MCPSSNIPGHAPLSPVAADANEPSLRAAALPFASDALPAAVPRRTAGVPRPCPAPGTRRDTEARTGHWAAGAHDLRHGGRPPR
jgi:hypothetical protein